MIEKKKYTLEYGLLIIICAFLPSFLAIFYGYGAILLKWNLGLRLAGINWVTEWGFSLDHIFEIVFGLMHLGLGIFIIYLGLVEKKKQIKYNIKPFGYIIIIITIANILIFYWESSLIQPMPIWLPITPIIFIIIGIYLIKTY